MKTNGSKETKTAFPAKIIARIQSDFPEKFGIPRQSGLVPELLAKVVPEPPYRVAEAFRGIEEFSHIWLIWDFSASHREAFSPTVRPPRLGGNRREGVFATRSPFRPNPIGLSSVRLVKVLEEKEGISLLVSGADLMDGTPILDIKPYLPFTDAHPDAAGGFADRVFGAKVKVACEEQCLSVLPEEKRTALLALLAEDPRPAYQEDPSRVYGLPFAGFDVRFTVQDGILTVTEIKRE